MPPASTDTNPSPPARPAPWWRRLAASLAWLALAATVLPSAPSVHPGGIVVRTPSERLERRHLAAAHEAVKSLQRERQPVPPLPGLRDFRCIFHAHAEDASHTGGTRPEMLADAQQAGVHAVFLSDHFRPPRDFMDSWRGFHEGVLFVPGSEVRGFLAHPFASVMPSMDAPVDQFVRAIGAGEGLIFLSHIEERPDHSMEGLSGLEIYNRHYDAKRDIAGLIGIGLRLTDPEQLAEFGELVKLYPDEILAAQVRRAEAYLDKWDEETRNGRRLTGVAANDCHHNQVLIVKMIDASSVRVGTIVDKDDGMRTVTTLLRPGIAKLTAGRQPGDVLARVDLDPYFRSFRNVSTHLLAPELTEAALRAALRAGHAYVAHEWMCDATGFRFEALADGRSGPDAKPAAILGDELPFASGLRLRVMAPAPAHIRLLKDGRELTVEKGRVLEFPLKEPGIYRCELALEIDGERREWIYSNPIYVRGQSDLTPR